MKWLQDLEFEVIYYNDVMKSCKMMQYKIDIDIIVFKVLGKTIVFI